MTNYDSNGLKASDYEHPADREALNALKKIPVIDILLGQYLDFIIKSNAYTEINENCFQVTEKTYPHLYHLYETALHRLNMKKEPLLFIKLQYDYNAFAIGTNSPYIVIHSSVVNDGEDADILYLLGHELGHVNSGHVLYHNLADNLNRMLNSVLKPASWISGGLLFALMDWQRKSELTADRAGLIACGDVKDLVNCHIKIMGAGAGNKYVHATVENMLEQYQDFDASKDGIVSKLIYFQQTAMSTHPWCINRIKAAVEWSKTEEYLKIRNRVM